MKINTLNNSKLKIISFAIFIILATFNCYSQRGATIWSVKGNSYFKLVDNEILEYTLPSNEFNKVISNDLLTPKGSNKPISIAFYKFSIDENKVLIFTNTKKVWRLNTRGDYWLLDRESGDLHQLGKTFPPSSLMFAKIAPDGKSVAYVVENNIYVEEISTADIKALTTDGSVTMINGTFDWAYEEEFYCRDGFRWSPDSKSIAYWQIDAGSIRKFYMINNTDSVYSQIIPLEYPKVGENPSLCRVGVVNIDDAKTTWMDVPGDPVQHYIVRMEFIPGTNNLLLQQLNRKQNHSKIIISETSSGKSKVIQEETDDAWVDIFDNGNPYSIDYTNNFIWMDKNRSILWTSEKDGWRHLYQVTLDGKPEKLLTKGNFDVISLKSIDQLSGYIYYLASPDNATQKYLYRSKISGSGSYELLSPENLKGTHDYSISPRGKYAYHTYSNHFTRPSGGYITLPDHKSVNKGESIPANLESLQEKPTTEFFKIKTEANVEMDGWIQKPENFDPTKKYPVVFFVYTEPAGANVTDTYGVSRNRLYVGDMAKDGYIYISVDNRGTPAPKGREWRKSIYRKIGQINIHDQAMAAKEILKWNFIDPERVAVWGRSGGGTATLNLMFQYPEIYKTGIAVAAVGNMLTYDNIYQERYMGLPQENREDFIKGSPITYARNLSGNLLYIHGTGDDNVHYQNADMLVNELIKHNRQFQFMPYPNRTHSISEGEGTSKHLSTLYTNYLHEHCPPGGR